MRMAVYYLSQYNVNPLLWLAVWLSEAISLWVCKKLQRKWSVKKPDKHQEENISSCTQLNGKRDKQATDDRWMGLWWTAFFVSKQSQLSNSHSDGKERHHTAWFPVQLALRGLIMYMVNILWWWYPDFRYRHPKPRLLSSSASPTVLSFHFELI